ncbi:hypothetical protein LLE49_13765 [Alicyclobacillus tolerans]|uniref:hypothetical protein n=1 Tax=Alicyclobacillus tolerans TaxID=90970 RepID=UPI001F2F1531|nr:hypothetical protein [Alicyclobacillus tolerans]MCF8565786.1 hypothetical protein [Alicyclobacillus tolerans]
MGQWTWLHTLFPLADIELMSEPIDPKTANVLVRTVRRVADDSNQEPVETYEVRVAPHNVAPFRGGPWLHRFTQAELSEPGEAVAQFRLALFRELQKLIH